MGSLSYKTTGRRGAAAVEFAVLAPLLFALLFALIEFSRAAMVLHVLEGAANRGCRAATCELGTVSVVNERIASVLAASGVNQHTVTITPAEYPNIGQWEPVTVSVSVNFNDVSWLPLPRSLAGRIISGSATLPMESGKLSNSSEWIGDRKRPPPPDDDD